MPPLDKEISPTLRTLAIGIFAYNEANNITETLKTLAAQDIFVDPTYAVTVHVLANGCTDATAIVAQKFIEKNKLFQSFVVHDLPESGKSRTWNRFVHDFTEIDVDLLMFCDADISIPNPDNLSRLVRFFDMTPSCRASSSEAVKDISHMPDSLSLIDRFIVKSAGGLNDWQTAIVGHLYVTDAKTARSFHLPIGLPVEDGFVRAMILTDVFRVPTGIDCINSEHGIFHIYRSERSISALIRHQTRLVIGSAINAAIFKRLSRSDDPQSLLKEAAHDETWVQRIIQEELPKRYGYVPVSFMTKRMRGFWDKSSDRKVLALVGFIFDAVVYVLAQFRMARGTGAGFW